MVKINVGDYEVVESGVFSIVNDSPVIELDPRVRVKLVFETDSSDKSSSKIKWVVNEKGELEYTLINFNNPLGTEFTQLAEIGFLKGRKLYFHVKVLGNASISNKTIFYTFYLGGPVTNG